MTDEGGNAYLSDSEGQAVTETAPGCDPLSQEEALEAPTRRSIQDLLTAGGWSSSDVIVSVYYIGVDFEYRRWVWHGNLRNHIF